MKQRRKKLVCAALAMLSVISLPLLYALGAYDSDIRQNTEHSAEDSMYLYTLDLSVSNACESGEEDETAVLQFNFTYHSDNGLGGQKNYVLDMSWDDGKDRNLNDSLYKEHFVRPNDDGYTTSFSVWIPGIVDRLDILLNMDGGERLAFEVAGISLNGYRVNVNTDNVSSAFWDSKAEITCYTPAAAIVSTDADVAYGAARDQYGGLFTQTNRDKAVQQAKNGVFKLFYHHTCS